MLLEMRPNNEPGAIKPKNHFQEYLFQEQRDILQCWPKRWSEDLVPSHTMSSREPRWPWFRVYPHGLMQGYCRENTWESQALVR